MSLSINVWACENGIDTAFVTIKTQHHSEEYPGLFIKAFQSVAEANNFATVLCEVLNIGISDKVTMNIL